MTAVAFTILGEPASKANSREIVTRKKRRADGSMQSVPASIKSAKARDYEADALKQIPPRFRIRIEADVVVVLRIFYASRRPDLDESVVLDVLQDRWSKRIKDAGGRVLRERQLLQAGVYMNDRQVREKHVFWGLDKSSPRVEVVVAPLDAEQMDLLKDLPTVVPLGETMQASTEVRGPGAGPYADQLDPAGVQF